MNTINIESMPLECLYTIFSFLPLVQRFQKKHVSKYWSRVLTLVILSQRALLFWRPMDDEIYLYQNFKRRHETKLCIRKTVDEKFAKAVVTNFRQLEELTFHYIRIEEKGMKQLAKAYPGLKKLSFRVADVNPNINVILKVFAEFCPCLQSVVVVLRSNTTAIQEDVLNFVAKSCSSLNKLSLCVSQGYRESVHSITGVSLECLRNLKQLYLNDCPFLKYELFATVLGKIGPSLEVLSLEITKTLPGEILRTVGVQCGNLKSLCITIQAYNPDLLKTADFLSICNLQKLTELDLLLYSHFPKKVFNDDVLEAIMKDCRVVKDFALSLPPDSITINTMTNIAKYWPRLESLSLLYANIDNNWCCYLKELKNIYYLNVFSDKNLADILEVYRNCRKLKVLDIKYCENIHEMKIDGIIATALNAKRKFTLLLSHKYKAGKFKYIEHKFNNRRTFLALSIDVESWDFMKQGFIVGSCL